MPDVILNFKIQETGTDEVLDSLTATGQVEAQMAANVKAANASFAEQAKAMGAAKGSADSLSASLKNVPKVIVGGAAREVEELRKKVQAGKLSIDAFATAINLAKKQLDTLPQGSKAFNQLQNEIKASVLVNEQLNKSFTSTRGQLRAMREALTQLEDAGFENTNTFRNLAIEAGALDDQLGDTQARIKALGSDTLSLDAGIQAVQGVTAAFSVMQGAVALAGTENEELQQALLKVNAAMSILNGLQQLQIVLQKNTILSIVTENALRRISAASTALQSAAESRYTIIRVAATAAQNALNAAMAANPAGVLLLAISAVAGAILLFTNRTDDAAAAQEKLAESIRVTAESAQYQTELLNILASGYQTEIDLLRARGAERSVIARAETESIRKQIEDQRSLQTRLRESSGAEEEYSASVAKEAQLRGQLRVKEVELGTAILEEGEENSKKALENNRKNLERFLNDQIAANEIALLEARTASEKLTATINLAQARARAEIASPDATANERILAEVRAGEEIRKARQDLFGELTTIERDHSTQLTDIDQQRIQANAQADAQILEGKRQLAEEQLQIIRDRAEQERAIEQQVIESSFNLASGLASVALEISRNQADTELAILQDRLDRGLISEQEYDRQVRVIKRRQAQQDKSLAIFQATINAASAILRVFASTPPPASFALAALTAALTAAQIAAIASQPLPAFAKGTKNAPGGPSLVGEAGPELIFQKGKFKYARKATIMNLNKGDKVIPALETQKILNAYNIATPHIGDRGDAVLHKFDIDYNKLGESIGHHIAKLPLQVNNWDERGFSRYQSSISKRYSYLNKKYKI